MYVGAHYTHVVKEEQFMQLDTVQDQQDSDVVFMKLFVDGLQYRHTVPDK